MNAIAIDFETANRHPSSACSLGMAFIENGRVTGHRAWPIRPAPFYFDPFHTAIHKIRQEDVQNAPTFAQLWPELCAYFDHAIVVAHNAAFDIGVLESSLRYYGLPIPSLRVLCTLRLSQSALPKLPSHRLDAVSRLLDIPLVHHQAESDALACAEILCAFLRREGLRSLEDLKKQYRLIPGACGPHAKSRPCRLRPLYPLPADILESWENNPCPDAHFYEKSFVFSGRLSRMPRKKAWEVVIRGGGVVLNHMASYADYLILGSARGASAPQVSRQELQARALRAQGYEIQVLSEEEFYSMIGQNLCRACLLEYPPSKAENTGVYHGENSISSSAPCS